jgi:hypothetical protein
MRRGTTIAIIVLLALLVLAAVVQLGMSLGTR